MSNEDIAILADVLMVRMEPFLKKLVADEVEPIARDVRGTKKMVKKIERELRALKLLLPLLPLAKIVVGSSATKGFVVAISQVFLALGVIGSGIWAFIEFILPLFKVR
jgi:hypothetical protein